MRRESSHSSVDRSRLFTTILFLLAILCTAMSATRAQAAVGRTPGAFAVSPTGASTYTIPIWAPPGPNGMQPNISLRYNSRQANGYVGVGWSVAGLSAIYRCNQTYAQDGAPGPVTLTATDVFCMDGKRLRLTSGTYGSAGSTYQTEVADFSNVTAYGAAGNGPAYFVVQTRDGRTYTYGNGGNSQVPPSGCTSNCTAISWQLNEVSDPAGNTMTFAYTLVTGQAVPATISWTPTSHGATSYAYTMTFAYTTNVPQSSIYGYVAGTPVTNTELLSTITVDYNSSTVKQYALSYSTSPVTSRYHLSQIEECADSAQSNCLAPTTFTYQAGTLGVGGSAITIGDSSVLGLGQSTLYTSYDFNGDGHNDLLWYASGTWMVALSNAGGYSAPINTGITAANAVFDTVDGTGVDGILAQVNGVWTYYKWSASASAFEGTSTGVAVDETTAGSFVMADVNGDGLPDLITTHSDGYLYVRLNTSTSGSVSFASTPIKTVQNVYYWLESGTNTTRRFDFNGSGQADVLGFNNGSGAAELYLLHFNGTTFVQTFLVKGSNITANVVDIADYNDDGCTDVMISEASYDTILLYSACNGSPASNLTVGNGALVLGGIDWDGDGRRDILVQNGSTLGVYLSTGNGFSSTLTTTSLPTSNNGYVTIHNALGDGLDSLADLSGTSPFPLEYYARNDTYQPPDLLAQVTDGYGNYTSLTYATLPQTVNANFYPGTDAPSGYENYLGPLTVVTKAVYNDPSSTSGGTYYVDHFYGDAWVNLQGRGFAGFKDQQTYDSRNGIWETRSYGQIFPYTGMSAGITQDQTNVSEPIVSQNLTLTDIVLSSGANNQRYFPYVSNTTVSSYEVGGAKNTDLVKTTSTTYTYDNYGNPTKIVSTVTDNDNDPPSSPSPYNTDWWTTTVTNTTDVDTSTWCLNLFTQTQVTYTSNIAATVTRTKQFTPDLTNCRYTQIITEPSSVTYKVTESLGYDEFGNVNSDSVTGIAMGTASPATRTRNITWYNNTYSTGQLPLTVQDPSGATQQLTYNYNFAVPISSVDPNGDTTSWTYDGFGRKTQENRPDTTSTILQYNDCASTGGCLIGSHELALVYTIYSGTGSALYDGTIYYDPLQRPLISTKQLLNGTYERNEMRYDSLGRTAQQAAPCAWSSVTTLCPYWTVYTYDMINRVTQVQRPTSASNNTPIYTTASYQGDTVVTTDPENNQTTNISSAVGLRGRTQDANGYYVNFSYDAYGSLTGVTDSLSHTLGSATYGYGLQPFKLTSFNIDAGSRSYTYDALGEVTAWSDAKGQSFTANYDALSRMTARYEPDFYSQWVWGASTSAHNWGKLVSTCTGTGTSPTACTAATGYSESETYDNLGRLSQRTIQIPSVASPLNGTYTYTWQYNATTGLLNTLTYPTSTSGFALQLQYGYSYGILTSVTDVADSPNVTVWTGNAENDREQITQATLGNGVVVNRSFDAVTGMVQSIQAGSGGGTGFQNQAYLFDVMGNLTQRQDNNLNLTENFYYDTLYRLNHSTLNGTLNLQMGYDNTGNITSKSDVSSSQWTYDPTHIHQVLTAGSNTYAYDANGNVLTRNGSGLSWTSYNYPSAISSGSYSGTFYYDQNRQRYYQQVTDTANTEQTAFVGGQLELTYGSGTTMWRHYVYAGKEPVAIIYRESNGTNFSAYILKDHMGSVVSMLQGTWDRLNESFAPYGYERNAADWSSALPAADAQNVRYLGRRGFAFQTVIGSPGTTNALGLIHMNGRVMDVADGRFLSPDPHITDPRNTQDYNRYSYVRNNPLSFIDPTGFNVFCTSGDCSDASSNPFDTAFTQCIGNCSSAGDSSSQTSSSQASSGELRSSPWGINSFSPLFSNAVGSMGDSTSGSSSGDQDSGDQDSGDQVVSGAESSPQGDSGPAAITITADRFYSGISSWPQGSGNLLNVSQGGTDNFWDFERDPDSPYYATPLFLARFQGSPEEVAVTATMVTIYAGSYPVREVLTGADLQLPGGGGALYDIYTVGPPETPIPDARIANVRGSNIFYYSPYHYRPGPGVPNAYVQFLLNSH
jgi:RHS repeat-associated protein